MYHHMKHYESIEEMAAEFDKIPKPQPIQAILLRGDLPPASGQVLLEEGEASFFPIERSIVGTSLPQPVKLKRLDTGFVLTLLDFRWHDGCSHGDGKVSP